MRILVSYRGIPQSPGWATGDMVVKAFRALGHEAYPYAKYYQQNSWVEGAPTARYSDGIALDEYDWDLILFMECNDGDPQYHELKVTRSRKTACWLFDTSYHSDRYTRLVDYFRFDHIFLANPLTIREYKVWGYDNLHYMPYACDRELHVRSLDFPKDCEVALVGSIREDRKQLARSLSKHGIKLELIGDVYRESYIDALASARIVINQNPPQGHGLLNMRHFEAQAAGCILFEQWHDLDVNLSSGLFDTGYVINYENVDEIPSLLHSYSDLEIAQEEFLKHHTYENRCTDILSKVFPNG